MLCTLDMPSTTPAADHQGCHKLKVFSVSCLQACHKNIHGAMLSSQRVLDIDSGSAGAAQEKLGHPDLKVKTGPASHALSEDASNEETLSSDPMEDEGVHPQQAGALLYSNTGAFAQCEVTPIRGTPAPRMPDGPMQRLASDFSPNLRASLQEDDLCNVQNWRKRLNWPLRRAPPGMAQSENAWAAGAPQLERTAPMACWALRQVMLQCTRCPIVCFSGSGCQAALVTY